MPQSLASWTPERIQLLRELHAKNLSCAQIAAEMNCGFTRNAIIGKLGRLGLSNGPRKSQKPAQQKPRERTIRVRRSAPAIQPVLESEAEPVTTADVIKLHGRISLLDARTDQCRWPAADDGTASMVCGAKTSTGSSWCPRHCRMGYQGRGG